MRWVKIIWTSIVVGGAMVWTLILFGAFSQEPADLTDIARGFIIAAATHWLSGVAIIVLAGAYKPSFPPSWHRLWRAERDGRIYERLGVRRYRNWWLASPFPRSAPPPRITGKASLASLDTYMRGAEFGHAMLLMISLPVIGWLVVEQEWPIAIWMAIINIPWNIYPVLLQRYNRGRLARIEHRITLSNVAAALSTAQADGEADRLAKARNRL